MSDWELENGIVKEWYNKKYSSCGVCVIVSSDKYMEVHEAFMEIHEALMQIVNFCEENKIGTDIESETKGVKKRF